MDREVRERMSDARKWYGDAIEYWKVSFGPRSRSTSSCHGRKLYSAIFSHVSLMLIFVEDKKTEQSIPATVDGMLGGFDSLSKTDAEGSKNFIRTLKTNGFLSSGLHRALDCGAGIGRVSKYTLLPLFEHVDLVEQNGEFLKAAKGYLGSAAEQVEEYFPQGLQEFSPRSKWYDVIWIQWVIGYLTDDDCVQFLKRCHSGLTNGGCICLKDNVANDSEVFDDEDSSVTRTHEQFLAIFKKAGLKAHMIERQKGFPKSIYKVNMYALS